MHSPSFSVDGGANARSQRRAPRIRWNELLGCACVTVYTRCRLVQELPSVGTIKFANTCRRGYGWIEVAEINAHPVAIATEGLPVSHAATGGTSTQRKALVTPNVTLQRTFASNDLNLTLVVVAEDTTVATAD